METIDKTVAARLVLHSETGRGGEVGGTAGGGGELLTVASGAG